MNEKQHRNAELYQLQQDWHHLTWWQKKKITLALSGMKCRRSALSMLDGLSTLPLTWLHNHILRRRARITRLIYPAHWLITSPKYPVRVFGGGQGGG